MRGQPSLPVRLNRMERRQGASISPAQIAELAEEYGLHPEDVRREVRCYSERIATYGHEPIDRMIQRLAIEFDLDPGELRQEAERMAARWEHKR